jgi:hypothetical protein
LKQPYSYGFNRAVTETGEDRPPPPPEKMLELGGCIYYVACKLPISEALLDARSCRGVDVAVNMG